VGSGTFASALTRCSRRQQTSGPTLGNAYGKPLPFHYCLIIINCWCQQLQYIVCITGAVSKYIKCYNIFQLIKHAEKKVASLLLRYRHTDEQTTLLRL